MTQYSLEPYFIYIEAVPHPDNLQAKGLGGAKVHAWVFETSSDRAVDKAIRYVQDYGWETVDVVSVEVMPPPQLALLDTYEAKNLRQAELYGINADFHAHPKKDDPGLYSVESLEKPPKD